MNLVLFVNLGKNMELCNQAMVLRFYTSWLIYKL